MKQGKPILLTIVILFAFGAGAFAADLVIESDEAGNQGKLKSDTFTFDEQASWPVDQQGRVFYRDDNQLYVSDGTNWNTFGSGKTIATRIVAASDSLETSGGVNPKADYTCDGTDDQVEIQQAIDDLGSNGGAVYLLEGTYSISASINFDNTAPDDSNKALIGMGAGTVLRTTASLVKVIDLSLANNILISQLRIDGNNLANTTGVYSASLYSTIDSVWMENIVYGIWLSGYGSSVISNNYLESTVGLGGAGILVSGGSSSNIISGNNIRAFDNSAIYVYPNANNNIISGNSIQSCGYGVTSMQAESTVITGNNIQASSVRGIGSYGSYAVISGNNVQGSIGNGIYLSLSLATNNIVSGNNVQGNGQYGIYIQSSASDNNITGNIISGNGGSNAYDGIKIEGASGSPSNNNIISSNRISDASGSGYGINITADCDNSYLVSNYITGAGFTTEINDNGIGTKYTGKDKITLQQQVIDVDASPYALDAATAPKSYVYLTNSFGSAATLTLADGKAAGDILILEGADDTDTVIIDETVSTNVNLQDADGNSIDDDSYALGLNDTLKLIWNGTDWLEVSYSNN